jgi:uncharacterized protein DUF3489
MAKSKSSTKVTARRTAAKGRQKGPAEPAAAVADNPPTAFATGRARQTKQALVLGLLQRKQGASLAELVAATSWLPHTTRAALTRLRQGGHDLQKEKRDTGETAYRIEPARGARARKAA